MNLRILGKRLRNVLIGCEIFVNRLLGREFISADLGAFNIETSSACNLKCKFCAYEKKQSPRVNMSNEMFFDCVRQAIDLGFTRFHLTPCTGDVFMDKHAFEKFSYLDNHRKVIGYSFFSNLTIPTHDQLMKLMHLKKLENLTISVYGHDEESFVAITKSTPKIYQRLLANLNTVHSHIDAWPFPVSIGFRSTFDVPRGDSNELLQLLAKFKKAGVDVQVSHGIYNNWGGYITQDDVSDLNIHILSSDPIYKSGACVKLFDAVQIMATGVVNACACRDVDATLRIGDIQQMPLKEIISARNADYMSIISEQQEGKFRPVCSTCDYYRSIYHQPSNFRREKVSTQTLAQYMSRLNSRGGTHELPRNPQQIVQIVVRPPAS